MHSSTGRLVRFSLAIISSPATCRCFSSTIMECSSGSLSASGTFTFHTSAILTVCYLKKWKCSDD